VCAARYAAVFPLSELINFFHRAARGQRYEELPHSYQMMLFWAGLRGAVGVALAAGFMGDNAAALRTTVLVVVVLTLIVFGGTTARMLEVLGIRMGVEDGGDADSSDDGLIVANGVATVSTEWSSSSPSGGRRDRRWDQGVIRLGNQGTGRPSRPTPGGPGGRPNGSGFSSGVSGSLSDESDAGEVLPPAPGVQGPSGRPLNGGEIGADGEWFTALDERYLLPLFSNSVASRKFHARRARRAATVAREGSPDVGFDTDDERDSLVDPSSPRPRSRATAGDFGASMGDFFRSLRGQQAGGSPGGGTPLVGSGSLPATPVGGGPSATELRWQEGREESARVNGAGGNGGGRV